MINLFKKNKPQQVLDFDDDDINGKLIRAQKFDYIEINHKLYVPLKSTLIYERNVTYDEVAKALKDKYLLNINGYFEWFVVEWQAQQVIIDKNEELRKQAE